MTGAGTSPHSRSESGEGGDQRYNTLFLTRTSQAWVAVAVAGLVLLIPLYLAGYDFAHRLLFSGAEAVAGTGAAESVVRFTGRSRKVGVFLFLASVVWLAGVVLLVPYPGELFESVRFRHYFDDDEEPAWFYLVFAGIFGGLAGAGSSLFWNGGIKTPEEAREQRRYEVGQELKTLLVVGGAILGIFGFFFTLYLLGTYVVAPVLRYFL